MCSYSGRRAQCVVGVRVGGGAECANGAGRVEASMAEWASGGGRTRREPEGLI